MSPRVRRLVGASLVAILLLFIGRWTVAFVAERWWAASLSPAAESFVARWQLLGMALDFGAIVVASAWFAVQALLVARVVASVQVAHRFGDLQLREAIPTRFLLGAAVAAGILLGLIAGAGANTWREPMALAWHGLRYGVTDPFLNEDLGTYVARLPAWDLAHRFAVLLGLLGFAFSVALYAGIGAVRRDQRRLVLHPDARRHLGILAGFIAVVIGAGYLLAPYHLVAAASPLLSVGAATQRIHAAEVMAGVSLATAVLSLAWGLRGRNALLAASWIVLASGAAIERLVVPALAPESKPTPRSLAAGRRIDAIAWGIHEAGPVNSVDTVPPVTGIWDEEMLARATERGGSGIGAATQNVITVGGNPVPVWLVATSAAGDEARLDVLAVSDRAVAASGGPEMIRSAEALPSAHLFWSSIADPRTRPGAPSWRGAIGGVPAGGVIRRLMLAWARQAPGMIHQPAEQGIDWHLDPTERAGAVLPMFTWMPAELIMIGARPTWLVQGMIGTAAFPMSTRAQWVGQIAAGASPAVLGTVDVASGETHFYADPAADSLGLAWASFIGRLVLPSAAIPELVRAALPYDYAWFAAQSGVLESPTWGMGRVPSQLGGSAPSTPVWVNSATPGRQVVFEDAARGDLTALATAYRANGMPQLRLDRREVDGAIADNRAELRRVWNRTPVMLHLHDSLAAAGDSLSLRGTRWLIVPGATAAWRPVFAMPRRGPPSLIWISTAIGNHLGGDRAPDGAWKSAIHPADTLEARGPEAAASLELARQWLERADSAFRRGDMTAFGRAYEELRRALGKRQ